MFPCAVCFPPFFVLCVCVSVYDAQKFCQKNLEKLFFFLFLNLEMCNKMKNVDFFKYDIMMCRV